MTAWIWDGEFRGNITPVVDLTTPGDGSEDPFCSGHTFLPDGNLLVVGGQDFVEKCATQTSAGHTGMRILDTSTDPPAWVPSISLPDLVRPRWYPTAITLEDGDAFIAGHANAPVLNPLSAETHERYDWDMPATQPTHYDNWRGTAADPCQMNFRVHLGSYPRVHLLSSGEIFYYHEFWKFILDLEDPICGTGPNHWDQVPAGGSEVDRHGGNTVHMVYRDASQQRRDVIYAIGGTAGNDDVECSSGQPVWDSVEKMVDPGELSSQFVGDDPWPLESPPDLAAPRFNHNSVILLDGSILVNGGWHGAEPCSEEDPVVLPERYRPPELFPIAEGSPGDVWKQIGVADPHHRRYHSTAGLLASGRVFSAGGIWPLSSRHSISIYSPPYFFYPRPHITSAPGPATPIQYGVPFSLNVNFSDSENTVLRVALVRNGSITHAWDMNQRYVALDVITTSGTSPSLSLSVQAPDDGYMAPPGYYLLTVVEQTSELGEGRWVPSPGVWVRVDKP